MLTRLMGAVPICAAVIAFMASAYARSATAESAPGGRRVALVIGNSRYRNVATLVNPAMTRAWLPKH
jgi:hypothetical protein